MSQLDLRKKEANADKVYYDLTLFNLNNGDNNPANSPFLVFNEQRQNSIINNTGDYYMSIVRFQLDTTYLPVFIPLIQTFDDQLFEYNNFNPPNPPSPPAPFTATNTQTIYSITVVDNTTLEEFQRYVQWLPQIANVDVPPPAPPTASNPLQRESEWFFCYNFEWFTSLVNDAIASAISAIMAQPTPPPIQPIAFLAWNTTSNSATIYLGTPNFTTISPATTPLLSIYFNQALFTLFSSFPASYYGSVGVTNGKNYEIYVNNTLQGLNTILLPVVVVPPAPQTECIAINQEWDTTILWTPVSSVVFTSATFPIVPNLLSPAQTFINGVLVNLSPESNNANFAQVITDLASGDLCYKPSLLYNPTAQYRLIDMYGNTPLNNINIQVFWKTKIGTFVPFRLATGNSCSIKLLFTKKTSTSYNGNQ